MLNVVVLMGRLTTVPELKTTQSGISVCRFTLAVERNYAKNNQERQTDFISCIAWRNQAEFITKYFSKGQLIAIDGSIQTGSYTDNNGIKRYTTDVVVNNVNFTGDRGKKGQNKEANSDEPPLPEPPEYTQQYVPNSSDDLPF